LPPQGKVNLMAGERELTTGLLAKHASFRLIVTGSIGVKEIERLIQKLEIDKEILADQNEKKEEKGVFKCKRPPTEAALLLLFALKLCRARDVQQRQVCAVLPAFERPT
jgi:hypothetical protein